MILENTVLVMPNGLSSNSNPPLVAIFMVTYNHEAYIEDAIKSVLSQNTTFNFQLFIGEDFSSDKTGILCKQYADQHPDKVKLFCREKNLGVFENANLLFQSCLDSGSKYIAMLEGDDVWISCVKLQKQIDLLEKNLDIAGTYHNTSYLYPDGSTRPVKESVPEFMDLGNIVSKYSPFHTSSFVFRSEHFCRPSWFKWIDSVDLAMYVWHAQFGKFQGINECMSLYRVHQLSMTAGDSHRNYFDDRRIILHRMMQGKIQHDSFEMYRQFIRFHEKNSKGVWSSIMNSPIGFFFQEDSIISLEYRWLRMCLEAPILNFNISENGILRSQDFYCKLYGRFYFFNQLLWRKLISRMSERMPNTLCFLDELSFYRFKKYMGSSSLKIFILFPFSAERFKQEKLVYKNLFQVDWLSLREIERSERLLKWNSEIRAEE